MNYNSDYAMQQMMNNMHGSVTSNLVSIVSFVLTCIATWILFTKAGQEGWYALIPFFRKYKLCDLSGKKNMFWAWLVVTIVDSIATIAFFVLFIPFFVALVTGSSSAAAASLGGIAICGIIILAGSIALLVINIILGIALAHSYGQSTGFGVGIALLNVIFMCIMAFSSNITYVGPDGVPQNNGYNNPGAGYGNQPMGGNDQTPFNPYQ